jgi:diaminopimelate epimerase
MTKTVDFAKMNGLGNNILVVDMRGRNDVVTPAAAIALAADPATRFDQIMAVHDPLIDGTDAWIDILNCDGTKAQACGNGTRCVVQALAAETGRKVFTFQTVAGILNAVEHADGTISVDMGKPVFEWNRIPLAEEFYDTSRIELQIGPIDDPILHSPAVHVDGQPACHLLGRSRSDDLRSRPFRPAARKPPDVSGKAPTSRWRRSPRRPR